VAGRGNLERCGPRHAAVTRNLAPSRASRTATTNGPWGGGRPARKVKDTDRRDPSDGFALRAHQAEPQKHPATYVPVRRKRQPPRRAVCSGASGACGAARQLKGRRVTVGMAARMTVRLDGTSAAVDYVSTTAGPTLSRPTRPRASWPGQLRVRKDELMSPDLSCRRRPGRAAAAPGTP